MVVGISMVKDEADIVGHTLRRMREQVDYLIVADNDSTDGTREIVFHGGYDEPGNLVHFALGDYEPGYFQSQKMTKLAEHAIEHGATWIVPFDADEVWKCRRGSLREALAAVPQNVDIVTADLYDHVPTALDGDDRDPTQRIHWRRPSPAPLPKVACRARKGLVIEQGNHGAHYDTPDIPLRLGGLLSIRHFPYRSVEQMIRKARNGAAAYAATDLPEDVGAHWRGYGRLSDAEIGDVFRKWFWSADPQADGLVRDPA